MMIDNTGYVKLIDMGFAKPIPFKRGHIVSQRSFSLCGTPDYVSPELVLGKGHDHTVDYWAYGVYVYELMVGRTPFFHDDQNQVFKMICNSGEFSYFDVFFFLFFCVFLCTANFFVPDFCIFFFFFFFFLSQFFLFFLSPIHSLTAKHLTFPRKLDSTTREFVSALLAGDPNVRLGGAHTGSQGIMEHEWFTWDERFEFAELRKRSYTAPFVPQVKGDSDVSNFDEYPAENKVQRYNDPGDGAFDEF